MKEIQLTQGKVAIVDDDDFKRLNKYKWYTVTVDKDANKYYAARSTWINKKVGCQKMSHVVLNIVDTSTIVDHKDGNGLNNQKSNLRVVTNVQNAQNASLRKDNKSGYKGVTLDKRYGRSDRWKSNIGVNKKLIYLGTFYTKEEAAQAYNIAAVKYFGEFARLNKF